MYVNPKYCECTKYLQSYLSKILHFTPRYCWEHPYKTTINIYQVLLHCLIIVKWHGSNNKTARGILPRMLAPPIIFTRVPV